MCPWRRRGSSSPSRSTQLVAVLTGDEPGGGHEVTNAETLGDRPATCSSYHFSYKIGSRSVSLPTWAPDGTRLAYIVRGPEPKGHLHARLMTLNPSTGQSEVVRRDVSDGFWVSWSPDGRWLLIDDWAYHRWLFVSVETSAAVIYQWLGGCLAGAARRARGTRCATRSVEPMLHPGMSPSTEATPGRRRLASPLSPGPCHDELRFAAASIR